MTWAEVVNNLGTGLIIAAIFLGIAYLFGRRS